MKICVLPGDGIGPEITADHARPDRAPEQDLERLPEPAGQTGLHGLAPAAAGLRHWPGNLAKNHPK